MGFPWQFGELIFNGETLAARNASIEAQVGRWLLDPLQRGRDLGNIQPPLGVRENQVCRLRVDRSHDMTPNGLWHSARSILLFVMWQLRCSALSCYRFLPQWILDCNE